MRIHLHQVHTMKYLSDIPGNIVGRYWEMLMLMLDEASASHGTCNLNLLRHQSKTDKRRNLGQIINDNDNHSPVIVYCPNAIAFDFVIFDGRNMIHAIQVTVQTAAKKCSNSDFFKTENIHSKYLI